MWYQLEQATVYIYYSTVLPLPVKCVYTHCILYMCMCVCVCVLHRLCLPGELVEDGRERAAHDIEKGWPPQPSKVFTSSNFNHNNIIYFVGTITVHVPKRNAGQYFDNLGMITALLSKKPAGTASKMTSKPLIEVLPGHSVNIILL